jgi:hypothetical protein
MSPGTQDKLGATHEILIFLLGTHSSGMYDRISVESRMSAVLDYGTGVIELKQPIANPMGHRSPERKEKIWLTDWRTSKRLNVWIRATDHRQSQSPSPGRADVDPGKRIAWEISLVVDEHRWRPVGHKRMPGHRASKRVVEVLMQVNDEHRICTASIRF